MGRWDVLGARNLLAVVLVATVAVARAQSAEPGYGAAALSDFAAVPVLRAAEPGLIAAAAGAHYGYTEDVLRRSDAHHRVGLGLAGSYAVTSWAHVGLGFDARYDAHSGGPDDGDSGGVGQSRLFARGEHEPIRGTRLGGELALRVPPAADFGAGASSLGGELLAMATQAVGVRALVSGVLGYRIDRSAHGIADPTRLTPSDRVALGASDSDAVRLGVLGAYDVGPLVALLSLGWDVLVGSRAPKALQSPMRLSLGARRELMRALWLEGLATFSLSQRPTPNRTALVPIEPRVLIGASVSYGWGTRPPPPAPPKPRPLAPPPPAPRGSLLGQVVDPDGVPVPGARVVVASLGRELDCDADSRFVLDDLPLGPLELYAQAPDWQPVSVTVQVAAEPADLQITLFERLPIGQIRGTIRGKAAAPLAAEIRIAPLGTTLRAGDDGSFVLDVAPGEYQVTISAAGYEQQQRQVVVEHNGVTVMLIDLRSVE